MTVIMMKMGLLYPSLRAYTGNEAQPRNSINQVKKPITIATPATRSINRRGRPLLNQSDMACLKKIWPVTKQVSENRIGHNRKKFFHPS
jgi:hypothetical protein